MAAMKASGSKEAEEKTDVSSQGGCCVRLSKVCKRKRMRWENEPRNGQECRVVVKVIKSGCT